MHLSLKRGAAMIAVIAALGAGIIATHSTARADEAEARALLQKGDYEKAVAELKPLAESGDASAQYLLAETYFGGHGGTMMEALKWMTAAAEQGYAQAQARLGLIYGTGKGVATNYPEAYRWFSLAAMRADPKQQRNLKTISETNRTVVAKSLTPEQRAKIDAEVAAWKPGGGVETAAAPAAAPATVGTIGQVIPGIRIQLAAVKTTEEAQKEWSRLQKTLGNALTGLSLTVEGVDLGTKGIFQRIQAGPFQDKATAAAKCEALKALKQDCLVVVRK
jgi:cell division septation protein DedD